jgi:very-short-patch-repair endonuclease
MTKTNPTIRGTTPELRASAKLLRWAMTPAERVLWEALKERQLAGLRFRAQHPIGPFILDFYCPQRRLVVEVDGPIHDDPDQLAYDTYRTAQLNAFGLTVLRLRNDDILTNLPSALARILAMSAPPPPHSWGEKDDTPPEAPP